ncbi:MAG TPA: hypothetical protein VLW50_00490 [Streptosporangiaceae bacterium]|nr:hypothetical protein [Streptosporangiaceae bacterium]
MKVPIEDLRYKMIMALNAADIGNPICEQTAQICAEQSAGQRHNVRGRREVRVPVTDHGAEELAVQPGHRDQFGARPASPDRGRQTLLFWPSPAGQTRFPTGRAMAGAARPADTSAAGHRTTGGGHPGK